ncbi:MAG TPA: hypothetical protein VMJ33_00500, partial [Gallionella sp.]|nr:hypothetical protein [Gallionella sp.]
DTTQSSPREILTPFRPNPLDVPEGMKHNEFFNSTENLNDDKGRRPIGFMKRMEPRHHASGER